MEIDEQSASREIQDQVKVMTSEEQSGANQSTDRSYECTFCKRGFTNAQALGGHMNIHRKEKAKLKQSTSAQSLSSNKMVVDSSPTRLPWVVLPTAVEGHDRSKGTNMDQKLEIHHQVLPSEVASDQKIGPSFQHGSVVSELDLELRLGPEPQSSTPSSDLTGSTRHFF